MKFLFYAFLGISPAIFWLLYIYKKDKWEPEPRSQVAKIFFLGIVSIVPAGLAEILLLKICFQIDHSVIRQSIWVILTVCFLVVGPIEEFFKYSVVKVFIFFRKDFNEPIDGVVYMSASAMGFAALENVMYIMGHSPIKMALTVAIMRGILSTPAHLIFSGFVGVYLGKAKFCSSKIKSVGLIIYGLLIGILLHGMYNTLAFMGGVWSFSIVPLLLVSGYILLRQIKELSDQSPFKKQEVQTVN